MPDCRDATRRRSIPCATRGNLDDYGGL
jgi:hypothetical protein